MKPLFSFFLVDIVLFGVLVQICLFSMSSAGISSPGSPIQAITVSTLDSSTLSSMSIILKQKMRSSISSGCCGESAPPNIAKPKPSCFDGVLNCHGGCEEEIDCGGPCDPCMSCSDGIQNQGEDGVDCGGPCKACSTTT